MTELEPWFSVEEIARHLGVSKETIYRWLEREIIPAHRMGKLWKFKPTEVDQWVRSGGAGEGRDNRIEREASTT
jgi:excisionase family DNA binding protein